MLSPARSLSHVFHPYLNVLITYDETSLAIVFQCQIKKSTMSKHTNRERESERDRQLGAFTYFMYSQLPQQQFKVEFLLYFDMMMLTTMLIAIIVWNALKAQSCAIDTWCHGCMYWIYDVLKNDKISSHLHEIVYEGGCVGAFLSLSLSVCIVQAHFAFLLYSNHFWHRWL